MFDSLNSRLIAFNLILVLIINIQKVIINHLKIKIELKKSLRTNTKTTIIISLHGEVITFPFYIVTFIGGVMQE